MTEIRKVRPVLIAPNELVIVHFRRHVDEGTVRSCWLWCGSKSGHRPGFWWKGRTYNAAVIAYAICYGPFIHDDNHQVLHTCDEVRCVNPTHLYLGTDIDNAADRVKAGLAHGGRNGGGPSGEHNGNARFTRREVDAIRDEYQKDNSYGAIAKLARKYFANCTTVYRVVRNLTYKEGR